MVKSYVRDQVQPDISVILPSYNERENILALIEGLEEVLGGWYLQIIVVDDNSPDGTHMVVAKRSITDECVTLINRTDKRIAICKCARITCRNLSMLLRMVMM